MNGQIAGPSVFSLELVALIVGVSMIVGAVDLIRQPGWAWKRAEESKVAYLDPGRAGSRRRACPSTCSRGGPRSRPSPPPAGPPAFPSSASARRPTEATPGRALARRRRSRAPVGFDAFSEANDHPGYPAGRGGRPSPPLSRCPAPSSAAAAPPPGPASRSAWPGPTDRSSGPAFRWPRTPYRPCRPAGRPTRPDGTSSATGTASTGPRTSPTPASSRGTPSPPEPAAAALPARTGQSAEPGHQHLEHGLPRQRRRAPHVQIGLGQQPDGPGDPLDSQPPRLRPAPSWPGRHSSSRAPGPPPPAEVTPDPSSWSILR